MITTPREEEFLFTFWPKSFKPYRNELFNYYKAYFDIRAKAHKGEKPLAFTVSKFSGLPYLPAGAEYPKDKDGLPMLLIAQINFAEMPRKDYFPELHIFPTEGIFQLFISPNWHKIDGLEHKTFYYETIDEHQTDFSFLTEEIMKASPVSCEHKLTIDNSYSIGSAEDIHFDYLFDDKNIDALIEHYEEQDNEDEVESIYDALNNAFHKIGGYGHFIQFDPRKNKDELKGHMLLLQIVSAKKIRFGDNGIMHLFINEQDVINKNFTNTYLSWECY